MRRLLFLFSIGLFLNVPILYSFSQNVSTDSTVIYDVTGEYLIGYTPSLYFDSIAPRFYGKLYEEATQQNTAVYTWVNELPQFVYDGKGTIKEETSFQRYIRESGVFENEDDFTKNARYSLVIERDGSISHLQWMRGKGDSAFYARIEDVLLSMPRWKAGNHNGETARVLAILYIMHPKARRKSDVTFGLPYLKDKNQAETMSETITTTIKTKAIEKETYTEPDDSITIAISPDESIELIRYVEEADSTYAVPCRHAYEEQAQCRTLVYWWVNEMPQFAEGKLGEDDKEAFCRYVHSCGIYDDATDCSANVAYDAVIERDGSVSNLRRTRGDGDTAFYSRVERMLLDMPNGSLGFTMVWRKGWTSTSTSTILTAVGKRSSCFWESQEPLLWRGRNLDLIGR